VVATAVCASLRGLEVFMMDLAALQRHIHLRKGGVVPVDPMKAGIDPSTAPHVIITLLGEFKGELGYNYHLMSLASTTTSGIELRWWIETLIKVREEEGCITGQAFGHKDGSVAFMREYDNILHHFLKRIQNANPNLISDTDDIQANYGLLQTFWRTAEGRARATYLDSGVKNAMNGWKKLEQKGQMPKVQHGRSLLSCPRLDARHMEIFVCSIGRKVKA
jgi:hypothetical protein